VVNEAMVCGLPVLVSENCGCVPELCRNGENGYTFNPYSTEDLVRAMLNISSNDEQLAAFGQASRRIISSFTPQSWATGLSGCVTAALDKRRP
jgi:glycosyltransferase involved in cell wall biosynthesis